MTPPVERGLAERAVAIARTGAGSVLLHPLRSGVTVACVVAIVLPWLVGLGVATGVREEVRDALQHGADVYVSGMRFGRAAPVPIAAAAVVREIAGVAAVTPRVVGALVLGGEDAVLIGVPADAVPRDVRCVAGRMFTGGADGELVLGSELAQRLGVAVGDALPPFYRNETGERVSRVVGIFSADAPLWQAHAVLASLETAQRVFDEPSAVTALLVQCPAQYRRLVALQIGALPPTPAGADVVRLRAVSRDDLEAQLLRRALDQELLLHAPFVLAFAVGVPLVLVTSGTGLAERRREAALLAALGWTTEALLARSLVESLLLAVAGWSAATLLAQLWLGALDGAGIAPLLLPGAGAAPGFDVPWRLSPVPALLALLLCAVLVAAGSLHATWRTATAAPAEAMR